MIEILNIGCRFFSPWPLILFYFVLAISAVDLVSLIVCLPHPFLLSFGLIKWFYDSIFYLISHNFCLYCFTGCFRVYKTHFFLTDHSLLSNDIYLMYNIRMLQQYHFHPYSPLQYFIFICYKFQNILVLFVFKRSFFFFFFPSKLFFKKI